MPRFNRLEDARMIDERASYQVPNLNNVHISGSALKRLASTDQDGTGSWLCGDMLDVQAQLLQVNTTSHR